MVSNEIASNGKIARLTDAEFRCLVSGVWPIASKAEHRGYFSIAGLPADEYDVAHQARKPLGVARSTLEKMRQMGMLVLDQEANLEFCHDWDEVNPTPKSDVTGAERQRRYRERHAALRNGVTDRDVTPLKLEGGSCEG